LTSNISQLIINITVRIENMCFNVAQLLKEPTGSSRSYQIEEQVGEDDINFIKGEVVLIRTNRGVFAKVKMTASVKVLCSRCLKPIDCEVSFDFEEEALPVAVESLSRTDQYDSLTIDETHIIDLSEAISQYVWLTVPAKTLCRLDCAGICPTCGKNLNRGRCKCPANAVDPRWSKLVRGRR
jgi:uncharacterized protein